MSEEQEHTLEKITELVDNCDYLGANALLEQSSPSQFYDKEYGKASKSYAQFLSLSVVVYYYCGRWFRCLLEAERVLALSQEFGERIVPASKALWVEFYQALIAYARGEREDLADKFKEIADRATELKDYDLSVLATSRSAGLYSSMGDLERADRKAVKAEKLLDSCHSKRVKTQYFIDRGIIAFRQNSLKESQQYTTEAFAIIGEQVSPELGFLCRLQAILLSSEGNHVSSLDYLQQAFTVFKKIGFIYGKAKAWESFGRTMTALNRLEQACFCLEHSLAISRKLSSKTDMALAYGKLGQLWMLREDFRLATHYFNRDLAISKGVASYFALGYIYRNLGRAYLGTEDYEKALANLKESLGLFQYVEDNKNVARVKMDLCEVHLALENPKQAEVECRKSKELFQELGCSLELSYLSILEAEILSLVGQYDLAEQKVLSSIEELEGRQHVLWLGRALDVLGNAYFKTDRKEEAWESLYQAYSLALDSGLERLAYRYLAKLNSYDESRTLMILMAQE